MARQLDRALNGFRRTSLRQGGLTDAELLRRYLDRADGAAFEALVHRYGPMVLGVCRRVLGNPHDAEDAFQATFLVLARKAAAVVAPEALGNWLYGVAYRSALKARRSAARRRAHEQRVRPRPTEQLRLPDERREHLDREIARLPDVYRGAVVLCELQGLSRKEAARRLGCPEGTLSSRLAKARRLLTRRLGGPAAVVALTVAGSAARAAEPSLFAVTASAATEGLAPVGALTLSREVMNAMLIAKVRPFAALLLIGFSLAAGAAALVWDARAAPVPAAPADGEKQAGPQEAVAVRRFEGHTDGVMVVAFSPDGKRILTGGACYGDGDPTVRLWDVKTGKELRRLEGHTLGVYGLAFLDGGKKAVSGSHDTTIRIWDLESGKELKRLEGHESTVYSLAVSPDGKFLLSAGEDTTVRLWDLAAGQEVRRFEGHTDKVRSVAFSPDGKQALTGGLFSDPTLRVWDVKTGKEQGKFTIDTEGIASVAFSPDGKSVLAGCMDRMIHVFALSDGSERRFEGHTAEVHGAAFSPDGKRILSAGYDRTVRLWDVASGKEVGRFFGHTDHVWPVAFSPDGKFSLSGSLDKTARLWRLP
jgi:RNA polymerase sigma factor (sigma-70 family)